MAADRATRLRSYIDGNLPEIDATLLAAWIKGEVPVAAFVDGETHRAASWSARRVAKLLGKIVSEQDVRYIVAFATEVDGSGAGMRAARPSTASVLKRHSGPRDIRTGDIFVSPKGVCERTSFTSEDFNIPPDVDVARVAPDERFNSLCINRQSDADPNFGAFMLLRDTYSYNVKFAKLRRSSLRRDASRRRSEELRELAVTVVVLATLLALVFIVVVAIASA